jgi:hypothetical protein
MASVERSVHPWPLDPLDELGAIGHKRPVVMHRLIDLALIGMHAQIPERT